ncbi:hypothetical protein AGIG_G25310 [Arapaima gigas]
MTDGRPTLNRNAAGSVSVSPASAGPVSPNGTFGPNVCPGFSWIASYAWSPAEVETLRKAALQPVNLLLLRKTSCERRRCAGFRL